MENLFYKGRLKDFGYSALAKEKLRGPDDALDIL